MASRLCTNQGNTRTPKRPTRPKTLRPKGNSQSRLFRRCPTILYLGNFEKVTFCTWEIRKVPHPFEHRKTHDSNGEQPYGGYPEEYKTDLVNGWWTLYIHIFQEARGVWIPMGPVAPRPRRTWIPRDPNCPPTPRNQ